MTHSIRKIQASSPKFNSLDKSGRATFPVSIVCTNWCDLGEALSRIAANAIALSIDPVLRFTRHSTARLLADRPTYLPTDRPTSRPVRRFAGRLRHFDIGNRKVHVRGHHAAAGDLYLPFTPAVESSICQQQLCASRVYAWESESYAERQTDG